MDNFDKLSSKPITTLPKHTLAEFKLLIIFSMLYMSIMLCNSILTNRYIGTDHFFVLGGSLTSPFFFIFGDIIAEIFGYRVTRQMIWWGFAWQTLFAVICQLVIMAPHPSFTKNPEAYSFVLGQLFYLDLCSFAAFVIANLVNAHIITRWKALVNGRIFFLRTIGASTISEALYSFIAIMMMEFGRIPTQNVYKLVLISYSIKLAYSLVFAGPASWLVAYIKKKIGVDIYDFPASFTPFKYKEGEM